MSQFYSRPKRSDHFLRGNDVDELSSLISSVGYSTKVKSLQDGSVSFDVEFFPGESISLGMANYKGGISIEPQIPSETFFIYLPLRGQCVINAGGNDIVSTAEIGVVTDGMQSGSSFHFGERKHLFFLIQHAELRRRMEDLLETSVRGDFDFVPEFNLSSDVGRTLAELAGTMHRGLKCGVLRNAPLAFDGLSESVIQLLLEGLPHRFSEHIHRHTGNPLPRHVKRAIEYMRSHLSQSITLTDIARDCGVSLRTLHQGFHHFTMTTPMAYLKYLRMEAVREELLRSEHGQTVADVVLKWGFTHLGRFSGTYRERFGEYPAETLRKSRS